MSVTDLESANVLISQLHALADECSKAGWNGDGAMPVDPAAVRTATEFIRSLATYTLIEL